MSAADQLESREALLLDLGALVYELHHQGRRAPDLLHAKAAELGAADVRAGGATVERCPSCGEPCGRGQLACLGCGERVAYTRGRRTARRPTTAAAALAAVALGAGLAGWAIGDRANPSQQPAASHRAAETLAERQAPRPATPPQPSRPRPWPAGLTANTVVLVTTSDKPAARRVAATAAKTGLPAGLIKSDTYDLGTGLWIVYAGRFAGHDRATAEATRLARRYPGAYPQLISRR
ncbi:MAG TPA: hypothetical protein VGF25_09130 [Thermoleophilaceae bacterium]|jgi:hypothetical protein